MAQPRHVKITDSLRERIARGDFSENDGKLPSEADLTAFYEVSRTTIRASLLALQNEGLVRSQSGVGYFVRRRQPYSYRPQDDLGPRPANPAVDHFLESAEDRKPSQEIAVSYVQAPDFVAQRLDIESGDFVAVRRRRRFLDGVPYLINDSYYPRDIVDGTEVMAAEDIARGVNRVLAERGYEQVRASDEIHLRMPYPDEVDALDILPGTPVAVHVVTGYTALGRPVRVARNVLPGDRHVIRFERAVAPDPAARRTST